MKLFLLKNKRFTPLRFLVLTVVFQQLFSFVFTRRFLGKKQTFETINEQNEGFNVFGHEGGHQAQPGSPEFWFAIIISSICVISAGICSGLTVGYLSIDELKLQICLQGKNEEEKARARRILPIIQQHHLLLSTLLVGNALAMETLPIYLHVLVPAWAAILFSTIFVVVLGEIIPQAFCTGPSQLKIADFFIPLIKLMILIFKYVFLCYFIGKALDYILGVEHKFLFPKNDLKALLNIHSKDRIFTHDQSKLMQSLFDLRTDPVQKQMVTFNKVFCLEQNEIITNDLLKMIKANGYSQIPVYSRERQNIKYILKSKHLLLCTEESFGKPIKDRFKTQTLLKVKKSSSMLDMLILFQQFKQTFALVVDEVDTQPKSKTPNQDYLTGIQSIRKEQSGNQDQATIIGIITLKDVFEEILDQQLIDEDLHLGQQIQLEELKQEKKRLKQEKFEFETSNKQDEAEETEAHKEEHYRIIEELKIAEKNLKQQKKKNQKQQQLIDNQNIKKFKNQEGQLQNNNELQTIENKDQKKKQGLNEPLLEVSETSFKYSV